MEDGDVERRGLARASRQIEHLWPAVRVRLRGEIKEKPFLPRKRIEPPDSTEKGREVMRSQRVGHVQPLFASKARQRPGPTNRPAPRMTGPRIGLSNCSTAGSAVGWRGSRAGAIAS